MLSPRRKFLKLLAAAPLVGLSERSDHRWGDWAEIEHIPGGFMVVADLSSGHMWDYVFPEETKLPFRWDICEPYGWLFVRPGWSLRVGAPGRSLHTPPDIHILVERKSKSAFSVRAFKESNA